MTFNPDTKVFSLLRGNEWDGEQTPSMMWSDFFSYLVVALLLREGDDPRGVGFTLSRLSDPLFTLQAPNYNQEIVSQCKKGLLDRYNKLLRLPSKTEVEDQLLSQLDAIFLPGNHWYPSLSGRTILSISYSHHFNNQDSAIASYLALMVDQTHSIPDKMQLPKLSLSVFGNIHLDYNPEILIQPSNLRYGSMTDKGDDVTALWVLIAAERWVAQLNQMAPGDYVGSRLLELGVLASFSTSTKTLPAPRHAVACMMGSVLKPSDYGNPVSLTSAFYRQLLCGTIESVRICRRDLLSIILDDMATLSGDGSSVSKFGDESPFNRLDEDPHRRSLLPKRPMILSYALEALGDPDSQTLDGDPDTAPDATDPSADPTTTEPGPPLDLENTIDLISFDKTGEGINEDLYRQAVMSLNKKIQTDDSVPVSPEVKQRLHHWASGFMYRAAIKATQDLIVSLGLQSYLKAVQVKG